MSHSYDELWKQAFALCPNYKQNHNSVLLLSAVGPMMAAYSFQIKHSPHSVLMQTAHRVSTRLATSCFIKAPKWTVPVYKFFSIPTVQSVVQEMPGLMGVEKKAFPLHVLGYLCISRQAWKQLFTRLRIYLYWKKLLSSCGMYNFNLHPILNQWM